MENNNIFDESTNYKKIKTRKLHLRQDVFKNDVVFTNDESLIYHKNHDIWKDKINNQNDNIINKYESNIEKNDIFSEKEIYYKNNYLKSNKFQDRNSKIPIIIFVLIFIVGILMMFYPTINNIINNSKHHYVISNYDDEVENTSNKDIEKMLLNAEEYNKKLNHNSIQDVFSTDKVSYDKLYDDLLKVTDDGLMGYIEIPKINIKLPIYHSTSEEALEKGVGHLKGSSLPIGGVGTHAILAAHRGLPTSKLFSDLDKVLIGDKFYISILGETLVYQVDNVATVTPSELDLLDINKDKDYITLVTCTPYGINSHRLLVRGTRIEETKEEITNELENKELIYLSNDDKLLIGIIVSIFIVSIIAVIYMLVRKK